MDVKNEVDTTLSELDLKTKDPVGMIAAIISWIAAPLMIQLKLSEDYVMIILLSVIPLLKNIIKPKMK